MRTATAKFNIEMSVICPCCDHDNDLEILDVEKDYLWLGIFKKWIADWHQWKNPNEIQECESCGSEFLINNIER